MYSSLNVSLSRTRGGIAIVTSIMAIIMAAMSGIMGGAVVLPGLIALPQMLRLGYNQNPAIGTICASGGLGTMIPPLIVPIFCGLLTETSIQALFTATFLPGFMLASFFDVYILIRTRLDPSQAPLPDPEPGDPPGVEKGLIAPIVVIGAVLGSIYGGITGITETAGIGVVAVCVLWMIHPRDDLRNRLGQPDAQAEIHRHHHLGRHRRRHPAHHGHRPGDDGDATLGREVPTQPCSCPSARCSWSPAISS